MLSACVNQMRSGPDGGISEVRRRDGAVRDQEDDQHRGEQGGRSEDRAQRHVAGDSDAAMKTGAARSDRDRLDDEHRADAGADAAAAPEADEHRPRRPDDGCQPAQHLDRRVAIRDVARDEHGQGALREIAGDDNGGPFRDRGPATHWCRPFARTDGPRIRTARHARDEDPDRDRPAQVGERDEGEIANQRRKVHVRRRIVARSIGPAGRPFDGLTAPPIRGRAAGSSSRGGSGGRETASAGAVRQTGTASGFVRSVEREALPSPRCQTCTPVRPAPRRALTVAVGSSNDFDLVVLGAGTGGYTAAFRAAQLGLRVALVDEDKIGGTCLHRGCIPTKAMLESAGLRRADAPREGIRDRPARRAVGRLRRRSPSGATPSSKRLCKGLKSLVTKNKVTWIQGRGTLEGGRIRVEQAGEDGKPGAGGERFLEATDVILATGSRVKSLPGLVPDGKRIVTSRRRAEDVDTLPEEHRHRRRRARSASSSLASTTTSARGDAARVPADDRAARGSRGVEGAGALVHAARHQRHDEGALRRGAVDVEKDGVCVDGRHRGRGDRGAAGRADARRHRPRRRTRERRPRDDARQGREGLRQGRTATMRTPSRTSTPSATSIGGLLLAHVAGARGHRRGARDRRREGRARDRLPQDAARDVLPAADRVDRPDASRVRGATACRSRSARCRSRPIGKALIGGEYEGFVKVIADEETDEMLGVHMIGPHVTDLIAEASRWACCSRRRRGRSAPPSIRTRRCPRRRRGGAGRRRQGDQLLMARAGVHERAEGDAPTTAPSPASLGDAVGLSRDDLLEMYRLIALARAVDERMWILNRAGKIPFVISGQGHEGAQVGIVSALRKGHDWMVPYYRSVAALITFGMSPREIMLAQFARGVDPSSGGRQMPGHYGIAERNILSVSSPVATQMLHATGIALAAKIRKTGQVAITYIGEGCQQPGRLPRGPQLRRHPQAAGGLRRREQRLRDQRADVAAVGRRRTSPSAAPATTCPASIVDGADVLGCYRAGREAIDGRAAGEGRR